MKNLVTLFKNNWKLLILASIPAVLEGMFGLYQLDILTLPNIIGLALVKLLCEFLFLGACLYLLQTLGIKNKWVLGVLLFLYYVLLTADLVLLWYFKERFGAKYFDTLQGGDYAFMADPRVSGYLLGVFLFSLFMVRKFFTPLPRKKAAVRGVIYAIGFILLLWLNPLRLLPMPNGFYTAYLTPPSLYYTTRALLTPSPRAIITGQLDANTALLAQEYNVFTAKNTGVGKNYTRVILIASESLSNKYLHHFNPNIPAEASRELDKLYEDNPSASLKHVTLSTLYGLTVIFTSHPYAQLSFENNYPISLVKELKKHNFHTAFLRGANEQYMQENVLFHQAGFDEVIGATYFQTRDDYKTYVNWWGLLDRKLFDYAVEYLQGKKEEPVFVTLLTVDSHVPLGRLDYLGETYRETDHKFYKTPTLPRAFGRFGQDVQRFLDNLQTAGLFDDKTLVLIMPDHPSYSNTPTNALFDPFLPEFDNLPFIIVTKNKITTPMTEDTLASQLDIAPTLLDLLNLEIPRGMFGHSLFDKNATRSVFDIKEDYAIITTANKREIISLSSKKTADKPLLSLMKTFFLLPPTAAP